MIIAVASGKGGTGKTTVATNLAVVVALRGEDVAYVDCDVEEPNGHIFLKPVIDSVETVNVYAPEVDLDVCTYCGKCGEICAYSAIVVIGKKVLKFPDLCHSCGGCSAVCPVGAISEVPNKVGVVEEGKSDGVKFIQGRLDVGRAMPTPVTREVKKRIADEGTVIIDAPPGTSCPVIEALKGSDYVILVTEPTPFGFHDLKLAVGTVRELALPFTVVINRADVGDDRTLRFCKDESIPVLAEIPDDRRVAEAYSRGELVTRVFPEYRVIYDNLYGRLLEEAAK
jgi:MinD superfamily P-loop ATPase